MKLLYASYFKPSIISAKVVQKIIGVRNFSIRGFCCGFWNCFLSSRWRCWLTLNLACVSTFKVGICVYFFNFVIFFGTSSSWRGLNLLLRRDWNLIGEIMFNRVAFRLEPGFAVWSFDCVNEKPSYLAIKESFDCFCFNLNGETELQIINVRNLDHNMFIM